jgi:hypothetical protein
MKALVLAQVIDPTQACPSALQSLDRLSFGLITQRLFLDCKTGEVPPLWMMSSPQWSWDRVFLWTHSAKPFPWDLLPGLGAWTQIDVVGLPEASCPSSLPCHVLKEWL